jgi:tRNA-specific adenosine deaminase 1
MLANSFKAKPSSFLLEQTRMQDSPYFEPESSLRHFTPKIHFYTSSAPCGDSSMSLTISAQSDPTPWTPDETAPPTHMRGRGYFSHLGVVRTKPGRADSPETFSKSCSDKLALRESLSLLLAPTAMAVRPEGCYISTLTMPEAEIDRVGCERSWGGEGRMRKLEGRSWKGGFRFTPFEVRGTGVEFPYSREQAGGAGGNVAAVWVKGLGAEAMINGVLQGRRADSGVKGAGVVSRVRIAQAAGLAGRRYAELKTSATNREVVKREVREVLGSWIRSPEDDFVVPDVE